MIAGIHNPDLLDRYIKVEETIGHTFRDKFSIREVRDAIQSGYKPSNISDWIM